MRQHILLAALIAVPCVAQAQTFDEIATYTAVVRTPAGALPPMLTNTLLNRLQNGASLALRYGNLGAGDFNAMTNAAAVTGVLPAGLGSSLRITGGVIKSDCTGCEAELMLGIGGDIRLIGSSMGNLATSPLFTVSLDGEIGYGNANPGSFFSGYVGLPVALVQRGNGMQFVPFLTPGFVIGRVSSDGVTNSGSGFMAGGGLGIYNMMSNVTVNVGAQHQFTSGARNVIGINLLIGGK